MRPFLELYRSLPAPNPLSLWANWTPIPPRPTMPTVLPFRTEDEEEKEVVALEDDGDVSSYSDGSQCGTLYIDMSSRVTACSATHSSSTCGVWPTRTPARRHAGTSMWSYLPGARSTFSFLYDERLWTSVNLVFWSLP